MDGAERAMRKRGAGRDRARAALAALRHASAQVIGDASVACLCRFRAGLRHLQRTILSIQEQIETGNLDRAHALIATAASKYPNNGGLENLLGVVQIQQGHAAEAIKAFSAAIAHNPRLVGAYLNLSRIRMQSAATDQSARAELCGSV